MKKFVKVNTKETRANLPKAREGEDQSQTSLSQNFSFFRRSHAACKNLGISSRIFLRT